MESRSSRRRRQAISGKKIVYITPYKNLANEMAKDYRRKGFVTEVGSETDRGGERIFIVYVYPRD